MFENPPAFWMPVYTALANITSWFDWDALAAIGTVGALWFIVVQTSRAGRVERSRHLGILLAMQRCVSGLRTSLILMSDIYGTNRIEQGDAFLQKETRETIENLEKIEAAEVARAGLLYEYRAIEEALFLLLYALDGEDGGDPSERAAVFERLFQDLDARRITLEFGVPYWLQNVWTNAVMHIRRVKT
ncbi:MAG: hypothetical protein JHD15_00730 [Phenylobacterium sp.]|uniref:hypothetical protein n=1 Tax=Phenylobacterium sp. TaxID=1871053 RepID=UPI001A328984|nr:hypothetical protein [Phenylobacterium sp.]MBJ7408881.1 hypothetical protein [Phenylobacterium sp.]